MANKDIIVEGKEKWVEIALHRPEADLSYLFYISRDREEGLAAFRDKRPLAFRGE